MGVPEDRVWQRPIERFGMESLVRLGLTVVTVLFLVVLALGLPGLDNVGRYLPFSFIVFLRTFVTIAIVILLYRIAHQARSVIGQLHRADRAFRTMAAECSYWSALLLALGFAYVGFAPTGRFLFDNAGFSEFYAILFGMFSIIPLVFLIVETGLYAQTARDTAKSSASESPEFQTDEQEIFQLLQEAGGTIYQGDIAKTTGWSQAKVSRILSNMESDEAVKRFRIGRQKIVCLPGYEPAFLNSNETAPVQID